MSDPYHIHKHRPEDADGHGRLRRWLAALGSVAAVWIWRRWIKRSGDELPSGVSPEEIERGHVPEGSESEAGIAAFAVGLLVLIAAVLGVAALLTNILGDTVPAPPAAPDAPFTGVERVPTESQLQVDPAIDLLRVRRREHEKLTGHSWVDQQRGVVSIPIDRAMEIMAARADTVSAPQQTVRLITESGFIEESLAVPEPGAPPFLGLSPERYTVSPEFARALGRINIKPKERPLE